MENIRRSGILLHITSLPSSPGIGTLGRSAYRFADWLQEAGQTLWQVLPLGPTGYGDSPYASFSTFAGNPLLVDLDLLAEKGWAEPGAIAPPSHIKAEGPVDFGAVIAWKQPLLYECARFFLKNASGDDKAVLESFKAENAGWLDAFAAFTSIKREFDAKAQSEGAYGEASLWNRFWPRELASCDTAAVAAWSESHLSEIEEIKAVQFFFHAQWSALKEYANRKGILIIGDIPIFVAADSADVWANQRLFQLDRRGRQTAQSGVPPDYFSETGQLWGNPLYKWRAMRADGYSWWIERIRSMLAKVDIVRLDHFLGFNAYWSVPAGDKTAVNGKWEKGPGLAFFRAVQKSIGSLPFIAEDLGVITDEVRAMRDALGLPGMKVLQFAFNKDGAGKEDFANAFLPHMYPQNCVVCTGTHDNDTLQGWLDSAPKDDIQMIRDYFDAPPDAALCPLLVRSAFMSVAHLAVIPLQDIYALGSESRMNAPSTLGGNWTWRMGEEHMDAGAAARLRRLSALSARNGVQSLEMRT